MPRAFRGVVRGNTVVLEEAVPSLEGVRVIVALEPEERALSHERQIEVWCSWVAAGPYGPIDEVGEWAADDGDYEAALDELAAAAQKHKLGY